MVLKPGQGHVSLSATTCIMGGKGREGKAEIG
jgi:hypothetical protein